MFNICAFIVEMKATSQRWVYFGCVGLVFVSLDTAVITVRLAAKRFDRGIEIEMIQANQWRRLR
ncbi:hypothetical protein [Bacillus litorisediminis]|uniref:hypothetical protein n=1 Tax=Bacillus litorisediminis TaxID=2922713 RepID=UPI001FAB830F|nr:hypothetical protein [Bacillus litorisediminis]